MVTNNGKPKVDVVVMAEGLAVGIEAVLFFLVMVVILLFDVGFN